MTSKSLDRPPILKFLILFTGLLAVALGLAALSSAADSPQGSAPESAGVAPADTALRPSH